MIFAVLDPSPLTVCINRSFTFILAVLLPVLSRLLIMSITATFFRFFKMAAAAILDFQNLKFLTAGTVKWVELHQRAKFRENRLNRGQNMAIFRFPRWRQPPSWILEISKF